MLLVVVDRDIAMRDQTLAASFDLPTLRLHFQNKTADFSRGLEIGVNSQS